MAKIQKTACTGYKANRMQYRTEARRKFTPVSLRNIIPSDKKRKKKNEKIFQAIALSHYSFIVNYLASLKPILLLIFFLRIQSVHSKKKNIICADKIE